MVSSLRPRPHHRLGMHPQAPTSRLVPVSLRVVFPERGLILGWQGQILLPTIRQSLPRAASLTGAASRCRATSSCTLSPPQVVGVGVGSFPSPSLGRVFSRLNFSRRRGVTRQDETGDPKLVHQATGEEVLFVMEDQEDVPIEVDAPITDGVPAPCDLVI